MHLDPEIIRLLITVGVLLLVGIPAITRSVWLPRDLTCESVSPELLTPGQAAFFESYDKKLAEVGYFPLSTFRATNLKGINLNRAYINSSDPARCTLTMMSINGNSYTTCFEIVTRFADGTRLSTKNTQLSSVLAIMPNRIVQSFPGIDDPVELKHRHDQKAETLQSRMPEFRPQISYFDDLREYHRQYCQYQESKKLLRFDSRADLYRATYWTGFRGVANFLNPIADNFTVRRFLLGVLFGAAPPLIVATQHAHIAAWLTTISVGSPSFMANLLTPIACTIAGVAVGSIFINKNFIWAIVLGYLPGKLLGITAGPTLGYGIYMAVVADLAARALIARRKLL
jgi:hypothetical protein